MLATYPGRFPDDPAWDSREVRRELTPIVRRLRTLLEDLEKVVDDDDFDDDDFDDDGRHGD